MWIYNYLEFKHIYILINIKNKNKNKLCLVNFLYYN